MTPPTTFATPAVPQDVLDFAATHGVTDTFFRLLEMSRHVFHGSPLRVFVEEDAEIVGEWYIVFEYDVSGLEVDQLVMGQQEWSARMLNECPGSHMRLFRFGMV